MSWIAVAVGGAALLGSAAQSSAARSAAAAGERSAQAGISEQREARESFEQRTEPFRQIGLEAAPQLLQLLGIDASALAPQSDGGALTSPELQGLQTQLSELDAQIASAPAALEGPRGRIGRLGVDTTGQLQDQRQSLLDQISQEEQRLSDQATVSGDFVPASQEIPLLREVNPLVSFLREEGFEDIQESAAAQGRLRSGGTLEDLSRFNVNLASTVAPQLQNQRFNQLFNLLNLGSGAATGQGTAALQTASNIGNLLQTQGAAQAQGAIQQGNIASQTVSDLAGVLGRFGTSGQQTQQPPPQPQPGSFFQTLPPGSTV